MIDAQNSKQNTGLCLMLIAIFTFSVANVFIKCVGGRYPIIEIVFFRNLFALIPAAIMVTRTGGISTLKTPQISYHMLCGLLGTVGLYWLFMSFKVLPLADATCFAYMSILFVTALSGPFLKEYIDHKTWMAVAMGFIGIMVIANPSGELLNVCILYSIGFSLIDAFIMLSARKLSRYDQPATIVFYYALFSTLFSGFMLLWNWEMPNSQDLLMLAAIGLGGGTAQICLTQAYKFAPAGVLAPMIYSSILWSVLFGYLIWNDFPSINFFIGSLIVVGSGLYIVYHKSKPFLATTAPSTTDLLSDQLTLDSEKKMLKA